MTTLASWVTNDSHGIASLYIASDSRASSACEEGVVLTDEYQKTFASQTTPDIFGIFGRVTNAQEILFQVLLFLPELRAAPLADYGTAVVNHISQLRLRNPANEEFNIIHGYRYNARNFRCSRISIVVCGRRVLASSVALPLHNKRAFHCTWASGGPYVETVQREDSETDARGLSRWQWQTFYDAVESTADPCSGGAPQLVGLYTKGNGRYLGVFFQGRPYYHGQQAAVAQAPEDTEWRDHLFQRVDGAEGQLLPGAQRHARNEKRAVLTLYQ